MAGDPYSLDCYADEVIAGLPCERKQLDHAIENQACYDLDADRYIPMREAESSFDYAGRPKRESGLVREVIDIACEDLYCPGPARTFDDAAGLAFLEKVWQDNLIDALMQKADVLATLNDVCAIQVDAGQGKFDEKPITYHLWGREEFVAWTDPNDAKRVVAVCTIDRFDMTTTYRLWNDKEVRTYRTKKAADTTGGRVATQVSAEPHDYGCLPFAFVHYELPVRRFSTPGLGTFVRKAEIRLNDRLSRLDESILKHLNPVAVAENLPSDWSPVLEPQRFLRIYSAGPQMGAGGYEPTGNPRLYYLQATIDVAGAWDDAMRHLNQILEACRIPLSAVRMEQSGVASGVAIICEQAPLLKRARKRRMPFGVFESDLSRTTLLCGGNHYDRPELVTAARKGRLSLGFPEPTIPVPTLDRNQMDEADITLGVKSLTMVVMERDGCTREQALQLLDQIRTDRTKEGQIDPESRAVLAQAATKLALSSGTEDTQGGSTADDQVDQDDEETPENEDESE